MALVCAACGVRSCRPAAAPGGPAWARDFFPAQVPGEVGHQQWGRHHTLLLANRVYASTGDDIPTQVMAGMYPFLLVETRATPPRVALIGIGSGVELAVLLDAGALVDLYEPSPRLLANAKHVAGPFGLLFAHGVPVHSRLRVITSPVSLPSTAPVYDMIVHANALTVICRPPELFTEQRFERLASHLAPGGVLGIHLQLYEITPSMHARLVRTFAAAFPKVIVMASESLSSDSLLYGSRSDLRLPVERLRAAYAIPSLAWARELAHVERALDPAAQVLLRDRTEALAYARGATAFTDDEPLAPGDWPVRPPNPAGDEVPEEDWTRWERESAAWRSANGLSDSVSRQVYGHGWSLGDPCDAEPCTLVGDLDPRARAELAEAQMAHGRLDRAERLLARATPGDVEARRAELLRTLLTGARPPTVEPSMWLPLDTPASSASAAALDTAWVAAARGEAAWGSVAASLEQATQAGDSARMLAAIALTRDHHPDRALALVRDIPDEWLDAHPAGWYFLARIRYYDFDYGAALRAMRRYIELVPAASGA